MAMMDNVDFLISHIRNAFVTSDDTSMSEWVITECRIQDETDFRKDAANRSNRNNSSHNDSVDGGQFVGDGQLEDLKGSMDIHPDMDFGAHRRRSNTAQRLEKLKKERRSQVKVKVVAWKDEAEQYNAEEKGHLFEKKDLGDLGAVDIDQISLSSFTTDEEGEFNPREEEDKKEEVDDSEAILQPGEGRQRDAGGGTRGVPGGGTGGPRGGRPKSTLAQQLQELESHGSNPFFKYAKFDGKTAGGGATIKLEVFLAFATGDQRAFPMQIVVTGNAKAQEVVGLVCWKYTHEGRKPELKSVVGHIDPNDLSKFSLHMAEDDGEIDTDFPPIVPTDSVSRYGFTKFALVANAPVQPKSSIVTIHVPNRGFNKIQVDSMTITMRELMEKVIKKRRIKIRHGCGLNYTLEKEGASEAGKPVDLDAMLGSMNCFDFYLIRENSSRGDVLDYGVGVEDNKITESLLSHQYKSFMVGMVHKVIANRDVHLGISSEKIEIDPVAIKGAARLWRQKPLTINADCVAASEIIDSKPNGRSIFRMTYLNGNDYKHLVFEADQATANEIVDKVNNILEFKFSPVRKEFVYSQERKALRKSDSVLRKRDSMR